MEDSSQKSRESFQRSSSHFPQERHYSLGPQTLHLYLGSLITLLCFLWDSLLLREGVTPQIHLSASIDALIICSHRLLIHTVVTLHTQDANKLCI